MSSLKSRQLSSGGRERHTTRRVAFAQPFTLGKAPEVFPAGIYEVETKEEAVGVGAYTAHVRTATMLTISTAGGTRSLPVKGSDLDAALLSDANASEQSDPNENPDRGKAGRREASDAYR